jgi:hypothetical protein
VTVDLDAIEALIASDLPNMLMGRVPALIAEVRRLTEENQQLRDVRRDTLMEIAGNLRTGGYEPVPLGYPHFDCENMIAAHLEALIEQEFPS